MFILERTILSGAETKKISRNVPNVFGVKNCDVQIIHDSSRGKNSQYLYNRIS